MDNEILLGITWEEVKTYQEAHRAPKGTPWDSLHPTQREVWLWQAWSEKHGRCMPYREEDARQKLAAKIVVAAVPHFVHAISVPAGERLAEFALTAANKILE